MYEPLLKTSSLTKVFNSLTAVDNISFDIYPGEILGLLGPNGAGKTTTIHMLLGLTTPTSGSIRVFGLDLKTRRREILSCVNFSSTYVSMPASLTVNENLKVFARLYGITDAKKVISDLLETFEIADIKDKLARHLSTGQLTRLNLAKSFINNPRILFLDEPTASLDPDIADKTRRLLKRIKDRNNISVFYTSHNMNEMESMSDRLIFLNKGKIIAEGKPDAVIKRLKGDSLEEVFLKVARGEK